MKEIIIKNGDLKGAFEEIAEKSVLNNLPRETPPSKTVSKEKRVSTSTGVFEAQAKATAFQMNNSIFSKECNAGHLCDGDMCCGGDSKNWKEDMYKGKTLSEMTREELVEAVKELGGLYSLTLASGMLEEAHTRGVEEERERIVKIINEADLKTFSDGHIYGGEEMREIILKGISL